MLQINNLTVSVIGKKILNKINFNFKLGKTYAVMGPNGSGKSTLASVIMGNPIYSISAKSKIIFAGKNISKLSPDKRANLGLFTSFQQPLAFEGVTVFQLLKAVLQNKIKPDQLLLTINNYAKQLNLNPELLTRSLNADFSGGERKKMEVLQAAVLNPKLIIYDEIDTGLDVDSLKIIANFINKNKHPNQTIILITHYTRILKYIKPDEVIILSEGKIVKKGNYKLAEEIEKKGYSKFELT